MRLFKSITAISCFFLISLTMTWAAKKPSGIERKADRFFQQSLYPSALKLYIKALAKNKKREELNLKIATTYFKLNQPKEAENWYKRTEGNTSIWTSGDKLNYAKVLANNGNYAESKAILEQYLVDNSKDTRSNRMLNALDTLDALHRDSLRYSINELMVNSTESDIPTAIYKNELYIISSRKDLISSHKYYVWNNYASYKLHQSHIKKMGALTVPSIKETILTGPLAFYNGEKSAIVTRRTSVKHKRRMASSQLFNLKLFFVESKDEGKSWEDTAPFPHNSDTYSNGQPSINSQGNLLIFVSDMPGGFGGTDLYFSKYDGSSWTKPQNLGPKINTESDELYPSIHQDTILYFSSDGHGGLGGLDILKTSIDENFDSPLENLGYPINSRLDDFGIVWEDDVSGFLASNRKEAKKDYDLFYFVLNKVPLKGKVISSINGRPLLDISLKLIENGTQKDLVSKTDSGFYQFMVYPGREYKIEASGQDYRVNNVKASTKGIKNLEAITIDITMKKMHQVFVNGYTRDDSTNVIVKHAKIKIVDARTNEQIIIKVDQNGEYHAEIFPDKESYLVAEHGSKKDIIKIMPAAKKDASISYNVYPRLKKSNKLKYHKVLEKIEHRHTK